MVQRGQVSATWAGIDGAGPVEFAYLEDGPADDLCQAVDANHLQAGGVHVQQQAVGRHQLHAGWLRVDDGLQSALAAMDDFVGLVSCGTSGDGAADGKADDARHGQEQLQFEERRIRGLRGRE